MNDTESLSARIDTLEMRVAHQERTIEDLNATVVAQWKQIDALTRQLSNLLDRVQEAEHRAIAGGAPEPPPPHY